MSQPHAAFAKVGADLTTALDEGRLTTGELVAALSDISHGRAATHADDDIRDAMFRMGWLLFVHASAVDGRYVALNHLNLGMLGSGQRSASDILDEIGALGAGDTEALDRLLTTHGDDLATLVQGALVGSGGADDKIATLQKAFRDKMRNAAKAGRWREIPLPGPDAATARGALSALPRDTGVAVLEAWLDAEAATSAEALDDARHQLDTAIALAPAIFESYVRRARCRFASGDQTGAGADLEQALALNPGSAAALAMRAELRAVTRDMQGSIEDWDAAVEAAPDQVAYRIGRGYTRIALGMLPEAAEDFSHAVALAPEDTTPLYNRADAYVRMGNLPAAIADYDRVLELAPDDVQARLNRGTVRMMVEDAAGAVEDFATATDKRPTNPTTWAKRSAAEVRADMPWAAWLNAMTALALADVNWPHEEQMTAILHGAYMGLTGGDGREGVPDDIDARVAMLAERAGASAALSFVDQLGVRMPGEHLRYHLTRANTYANYGKWQPALDATTGALAVVPGHAGATALRGSALLHLNQVQEAWTLLASVEPSDLGPDARFELHVARARALGVLQRLDEAVAAFREALTIHPRRGDVWFYLGVHLDLAGDKTGAIDAYTNAISADDSFAPAWFNRGCEYAVTGQRELALADLKRAASLDPTWAKEATTDAYFQSLWADPDFLAVVDRFSA